VTNIESAEITCWDGSIYLYPLDAKCKGFNTHLIDEPLRGHVLTFAASTAAERRKIKCHLPHLTYWKEMCKEQLKGRK
jgi:hypothetical protein